MGVLEVAARIAELGGLPAHAERVAALRADFEARTGRFSPEDPWFVERSLAFWSDAVTRGRFGRVVEGELAQEERRSLAPLERAHRGLFRLKPSTEGPIWLEDLWSRAEFFVTLLDEAGTRPELEASLESAASGDAQLFDGWLVGADDASGAACVALLPGPVFHPREATAAIAPVLAAAREKAMAAAEVLDALLRMHRAFRSLARVKAGYAYRPEALSLERSGSILLRPVRRTAKEPR
jgi:hypothetical protein